MLYKHFTEKLLGLQGLIITNVEENEKSIIIYAEMERKEHTCICCGTATNTVHDYREQIIKDIPAFGKIVKIVLRKRRYCCKCCGKRFLEINSFLPKYHRITNRLSAFVIDKLRDKRSFTSVAREVNLSVTTVIRIFDTVSYPKAELSQALSIDEFKGNTWGEKYQCILTDPVNKRVLDVLPERYKPYLTSYFKQYPKEVRNSVTYFVSDMWRTYADICDVWFRNATPIIDKYHWIRQTIWAFENVRKEEQKQQVNVMLYYSVNISRAYFYKEQFLNILSIKDAESAKKAMSDWIQNAENCGIPQLEKCADTMRNWYTGIINSFSTTITNGFTEGCNNKIKVLKRNAYGYQNFKRFRNRILHIFSHQQPHNEQAAA